MFRLLSSIFQVIYSLSFIGNLFFPSFCYIDWNLEPLHAKNGNRVGLGCAAFSSTTIWRGIWLIRPFPRAGARWLIHPIPICKRFTLQSLPPFHMILKIWILEPLWTDKQLLHNKKQVKLIMKQLEDQRSMKSNRLPVEGPSSHSPWMLDILDLKKGADLVEDEFQLSMLFFKNWIFH